MLNRGLLMLSLLAGSAAGEPEIHRCPQDDGTVAFQQTPCRPAAAEPTGTTDADGPNGDGAARDRPLPASAGAASQRPRPESMRESAPPRQPTPPAETEQPVPMSVDRAECEKSARDAIDAIDAELKASGNTENDRARLDELLELTRQLRLCRRL